MRRLIFALGRFSFKRKFFALFLFASVALIVDFYIPTINYLKFKYFNGKFFEWAGLNIRLNDGWYPIGFGERSTNHITLIKINPWIPNGEVLSQMDMIYQPDFILRNPSNFRIERMKWGDVLFYREREDVAFSLHGKLRIFFSKKSDLNEIVEISEKR